MDNLTLLQIAENCCPPLFKKFLGVTSADNFFSNQNRAQMQEYLAITGQSSLFYQIVNTSSQNQRGEHWVLIAYIIVPIGSIKRSVKTARREKFAFFAWDPLGYPMRRYKAINKRLKMLSGIETRSFEICFPLQNALSNLCGLYCLFMAHHLHQIGLANKIQRLSGKESLENLNSFIACSLFKLTNFSEIEIVRFFNEHCNSLFKYKIMYTC